MVKALKTVNAAIELNPDDTSLLLTKANVYYQQGNYDNFLGIMNSIVVKNPKDVDALYNIGVVNAKLGNVEKARLAYRKVLDVDPKHLNAGINLSKMYLDEANEVVKEMDNLENRKDDNLKYEKLLNQQKLLYKKSVEILENVTKHYPKEISVLKQLKGLYAFLGETVKLEATRTKLTEMGH